MQNAAEAERQTMRGFEPGATERSFSREYEIVFMPILGSLHIVKFNLLSGSIRVTKLSVLLPSLDAESLQQI